MTALHEKQVWGVIPHATASAEPTEALNHVQGTSKVAGKSQEEPPSRWRAGLSLSCRRGAFLKPLFPVFSENMCWLPIKQQQLPVKQASLCKAARGTLSAGPGSPGRFTRCHLRNLQFPGPAVQVQPAGKGGAGERVPSHSLGSRLCSLGAQRDTQAPKSHKSGTLMGKITRFLAGLQAGGAEPLFSSLSYPFGCSQLCLLISSLLMESRKTKEKCPGTDMGDSWLGFFSL